MGKVYKSQNRLPIDNIPDKKGGIKTYGKHMGRFLAIFGAARKIDGQERYVGIYSLQRFIKEHKTDLKDIQAPRIYASAVDVNNCLNAITQKMKKISNLSSGNSIPAHEEPKSEIEEPKEEPKSEIEEPKPDVKPEAKPVASSPYDSVNIPQEVNKQYLIIAEKLEEENRKIKLPHVGMFMSEPEKAKNLFVKSIESLPEEYQSTYYGLTYQLMKVVKERLEIPLLKEQADKAELYLAETYLDIEKSKESFNPLAWECARLIYYSNSSDEGFKGDAAFYMGREQEYSKRLNTARTYFDESYKCYGNAVKNAEDAEDKRQLQLCQIDAGYRLSKLLQEQNLEQAYKICDEIRGTAKILNVELQYVNNLWLDLYKKVAAAKKVLRPPVKQQAQAPVKTTEPSKPMEAVSKNLDTITLRNKYELLSQFVKRIDDKFGVKTPFHSLEEIQNRPWDFGKTFYDFMKGLYKEQLLTEEQFKKVIETTHNFLKVMDKNLNDVESNLQVSMGIAYLRVEKPYMMINRANEILSKSGDAILKLDARIYVIAKYAKTRREKKSQLSSIFSETKNSHLFLKQRLAVAEKLFFLRDKGWKPTEEMAEAVFTLSENRIHKATAASFLGGGFENKGITSKTLDKQDLEKGCNLFQASKYYFDAYKYYKQEAEELLKETDLSKEELTIIETYRKHQSANLEKALRCSKESIEFLSQLRESLTNKILTEAKSLLDSLILCSKA